MVETSDEWIYTRTGIRQRHIAEKNELTSNLAINAALNAFDKSEIKPQMIDCIIIATTTPDNTFPATATKVQNFFKLTVFLRSIYKRFALALYMGCKLLIHLLNQKNLKIFYLLERKLYQRL